MSIEELKQKIESDKNELQEIETLLEEDPSNEELQLLKDELIDLIKKSNDLLLTRSREVTNNISTITTSTTSNNTNDNNYNNSNNNNSNDYLSSTSLVQPHKITNDSTTIVNNSNNNNNNNVGNNTANNNSSSSSSMVLSVGTQCEGKYTVDGIWYAAVIDAINKDGTYTVTYTEYGNTESLSVESIRPPTRQKLVQSIQDQSSRYTTASDSIQSIPKYLKILPEDSEEVKKQKQKKIRSVKAQNRLFKADEENRKKKQAWQDFQSGPKRSIPGTFTDKKKGSMFSTPDNLNGKVGVVGSGRGMTESTSFSMDKKKCTLPPTYK
ncbi:putative splicing factor [Heterostelium album PN500]|uniref:Putative splicing factor n=1 Tax=Heterostelium pallidum (strain ATCC 26659 / Pp 5 / PN500) TaxID=670386 RepID=D3BF56_HETP5|nr:putative splicing factor [Heterostelium album PN500]EFA79770.1 putative splicing factor [Heterostelium album PN500]|eukprot:XP_020431891.1 putative splicing factor [Heterostelium album PN500]